MKRLAQSVILVALASTVGLANAQDIKIAVVAPITGSNAAIGEEMKRGAEMAVKDINDKGGVLGKKLDLIVADDACDPKQAGRASCLSLGMPARSRLSRRRRSTMRRGCCR